MKDCHYITSPIVYWTKGSTVSWYEILGFCKVVIYNYVFVGFYSMPNLIVILFNLMYLVFHMGFICKGYV